VKISGFMKYEGTGIIIQARLGSTRLPEKIILPFYRDVSLIELLIDKIQNEAKGFSFVVATTTGSKDDLLAEMLEENDINVYRGSEENVLERFIGAARENEFHNLIRICADNPFLDVKGTVSLLNIHLENQNDYTGYKLANGLPTIKSHLGLWGEAVSLKALEKAESLSGDAQTNKRNIYREHVTNFIYENKDKFKVSLIAAPELLSTREDIRLTVDTMEDFEMSKEIYSQLQDVKINFENKDIVKLIDSNPRYLEGMKEQIKKNIK
jgi:spore coat polysaccharide biosynthesis protein SpsF